MKTALVLALGLVSGAQAARAQDSDIVLGCSRATPPTQITVTATGLPTRIDQSGQSISAIGLPELQQVQGPDITRALERLPGVSIARSGSLGSQTSVFVRGANSEQLMVLVDGVKVEDPSAPSGGYDFGNLMSGGIGKIELLRGSNSVAWGSDAMAGVLNVATREIDGAEASVEGGSRNSWDANAGAGIRRSAYALSVNGGYTSTTGISAAANGTEPDGFHQWHVSAKGHVDLAEGLALVAVGRYATGKLQMDGYPAPAYTFADDREYQTNKQGSGRVGLTYDGGC
jgi:vitamin B12 transporter